MPDIAFHRHEDDVTVEVSTSRRVAAPIPDEPTEYRHPALSHDAPSTMHDDGASTDASPFGGPLGARGTSRTWLERKRSAAGLCPAFVFHGRTTFTASFSFRANSLVAFDDHLNVIDSLDLPRRSIDWSRLFNDGLGLKAVTRRLFRDTSGGAYFFVEKDGRVVIPAADNRMWRVRLVDGKLHLQDRWDFNPAEGGPNSGPRLPQPAFGAAVCASEGICIDHAAQHRVISALPTWNGEGYWFATNLGLVGVVTAPPDASVAYLDLNDPRQNPWARSQQDERIQNSFSVGAKGAFVVSDYALYRLVLDAGRVQIAWRLAVPRTVGRGPKPGHVGMGSGTTPTLVRDDYVAITDAGEMMKVILCSQDAGADRKPRSVHSHVAFEGSTQSACENSLVSFGNHLIVGNTYGYVTPFERKKRDPDVVGIEGYEIVAGGQLKRRWTSPINVMSAPPKLGRRNATLYAYTLNEAQQWTVRGLDPWTGEEVFRGVVASGDARDRDNAWGTIALGPGDQLYVAQWSGLLRVGDR